MEDAHACILDLKPESQDGTPETAENTRISFFGVYDGHGGDKVAIYTGANLHKIVARQEAFKELKFEQALKDGFLATDRAILSGWFTLLISWQGQKLKATFQILDTKRKYLAVLPR